MRYFIFLTVLFMSDLIYGYSNTNVYVAVHEDNVALVNEEIKVEFIRDTGRMVSLRTTYGQELMGTEYTHTSTFGINWRNPSNPNQSILYGPSAAVFSVIKATKDICEISFVYDDYSLFPFKVDLRYMMRSGGDKSLYYYAIISRDENAPAATLEQMQYLFFLNHRIFTYGAVSDENRRSLYHPRDILYGESINPKEAVPLKSGEVWCKYDWVDYVTSGMVFGFSSDSVGVWNIIPSAESINGGPVKQNLTIHETTHPQNSPVMMTNLQSRHYCDGNDVMLNFKDGESWRKVYGPFLIYINEGQDKDELWGDAKNKANEEVAKWPYEWVEDKYIQTGRVSLCGVICLPDGTPLADAQVVATSDFDKSKDWTKQSRGYWFTAKTDEQGKFKIENMRAANYNLTVYKIGIFGQKSVYDVIVEQSKTSDAGNIILEPEKYGKTLWQIGVPNRSSCEFMRGNEKRKFTRHRNYEVDFPNDVHYIIGKSSPEKDFNWAQHAVLSSDGMTVKKMPVWTIEFEMDKKPDIGKKAWLVMPLASECGAQVEILMNGSLIGNFNTGGETAVMFGATEGQYLSKIIAFNASVMKEGVNIIELKIGSPRPFKSVAYDFLRLEIEE